MIEDQQTRKNVEERKRSQLGLIKREIYYYIYY